MQGRFNLLIMNIRIEFVGVGLAIVVLDVGTALAEDKVLDLQRRFCDPSSNATFMTSSGTNLTFHYNAQMSMGLLGRNTSFALVRLHAVVDVFHAGESNITIVQMRDVKMRTDERIQPAGPIVMVDSVESLPVQGRVEERLIQALQRPFYLWRVKRVDVLYFHAEDTLAMSRNMKRGLTALLRPQSRNETVDCGLGNVTATCQSSPFLHSQTERTVHGRCSADYDISPIKEAAPWSASGINTTDLHRYNITKAIQKCQPQAFRFDLYPPAY